MKILLAEDDPKLAAKLTRSLHLEGFAVDHVASGDDAVHLGLTGDYECVVLDVGLPAVDGISVLRQWRSAGKNFPVLILTARTAWSDKSAGFAAGADDYLTKPFLAQELVVRLRALIRRARGQQAQPIRCGDLSYDPSSGAFTLADAPLKLTAFETRILSKLMEFREKPVARSRLFDSVYEFDAPISIASFEVLVGRLRRKIGTSRIETVRGFGYRLTVAPS